MDVSLRKVAERVYRWYRPFPPNYFPQIPRVELGKLVGRPLVTVDGGYSYKDGSLPWGDILALLSVMVDRAPKSVLEIGTFHGHTTRLMALNMPRAAIYTMDLPENFAPEDDTGLKKDDWHLINSRRVGAEYRADSSITNVKQLFGDTAECEFPDAELFFIDGAHTYEYVRNDTTKALASPAAKTLLWHDSDGGHRDVTRWLAGMIQAGYPVRQIEGTNLAILDVKDVPAELGGATGLAAVRETPVLVQTV